MEEKVDQRTIALIHARDEAEKARTLAEKANQIKSKFVANVSHEIRTPLNAIIGYSDILTEDATSEGKTSWISDLAQIKKAAMTLLNMINDILDMSKIESGKITVYMETFNIAELLREIVELMEPIAETNNNHFELEVLSTENVMVTDYIKVRQIFQNLISNANKFTKDGVIYIRISKEIDDLGREINKVQVADSGIGMSQEQLSRIFEPFQQADTSISRHFGGTGLGLAITKQLCEVLGGSIQVRSQRGRGTIFTVFLPTSLKKNIAFEYNQKLNGRAPKTEIKMKV